MWNQEAQEGPQEEIMKQSPRFRDNITPFWGLYLHALAALELSKSRVQETNIPLICDKDIFITANRIKSLLHDRIYDMYSTGETVINNDKEQG